MDAKAVFGARRNAAHIDVPDVAVAFQKRDARAFLASVVCEQAQINRIGMFGKDGKVHTLSVKGRPQRIRPTSRKRVVKFTFTR